MDDIKEAAAPSAAMKVKMAVIAAACGINSLPEEELLYRLEGLAFAGFRLGVEASKGALDAAAGDLAKKRQTMTPPTPPPAPNSRKRSPRSAACCRWACRC